MFQSTPPRGGRPLGTDNSPFVFVFQSTPPRGGRRTSRRGHHGANCFNPRPRVGGDLIMILRREVPISVSIHAPAWGATSARTSLLPMASVFQSTPPRGGRPRLAASTGRSARFQSTPPRGGRPAVRLTIWPPMRFNPRPRVGGDSSPSCSTRAKFVSIHAPAWGATVLLLIPVTAMITRFPFADHHNFSRVFLSGRYRN